MISSPYDSSSFGISSIFSLAPTYAEAWNASSSSYTSQTAGFSPGNGYWVKFSASSSLYDLGTLTSSSSAVSVSLKAGWNLIGNPRTTAVSLSSLSFTLNQLTLSIPQAESVGFLYPTLYTYQSGDTAYETITLDSGSLQPYYGYWIYSYFAGTLNFPAQ